jgi:DNA-binding GntR family transcriptional regulator
MDAMTLQPQAGQMTTLADQAYELIRSDIVLCRWAPGEDISEAKVVRRYGIGKASVRHALNRLFQDRLIRPSGKKGRIVAPLSFADIRDVFLLRCELEPFAARLAAGRIEGDLLFEMDEICRAGYAPGDIASVSRFLDANRRFHLGIASAAGSPRLLKVLEELHNEATRILYLGFRLKNRSEEWAHGHEALLDALMRPDPDEAARISRALLDNSFAQIREATLNSSKLVNAPLG